MPVMVAWALVLDARLRQRTTAPDAAPDLAAQAG
jgi:hypothetical protein